MLRSVDPGLADKQDTSVSAELSAAKRSSVAPALTKSQQPTRTDTDEVFLQKIADLEERRFALYEGRILYRYLNPAIPVQKIAEYRRHAEEIFPVDIERDDGCTVIRVPPHMPLTRASMKAQREPPPLDYCGWAVGLVLCKSKETRVTNIVLFAELAIMLCGFLLFLSADIIDVHGAQETCELLYSLDRTPARSEVSLCGLSAVQTVIGIYAFLHFMRAVLMALTVIWTAAAWCTEHTHVAHILALARQSNEPHLVLFEGVFYLVFAFLAKHLKVLESSAFCLGFGLSAVLFFRVGRTTARSTARIRGLWAFNAVSHRLVAPGYSPRLLRGVQAFFDRATRNEENVADPDIKAVVMARQLRDRVMEECDDIRELLLEVEALGLEAHDKTVSVRLPLMRDNSV